MWGGFCLTVLLQVSLQASNELSFIPLGLQAAGLTLLPQLCKLRQKEKLKHTVHPTTTLLYWKCSLMGTLHKV